MKYLPVLQKENYKFLIILRLFNNKSKQKNERNKKYTYTQKYIKKKIYI